MEQRTEQLQPDVIERLTKLQNEQNDGVIALGQLAVRKRQLTAELERTTQREEEVGSMIDKSIQTLNTELAELDTKYPNGQIDLEKGIIIY